MGGHDGHRVPRSRFPTELEHHLMRTDVTFDSAGLTLAGHLYTPDAPAAGPRPAVVVSHPMTGVKEQTAGLYAARLARAGFVALAFDAAHWGASEGLPRFLEDPSRRVEDIKNAVTFLSVRDEADPGRIGALGICASGGYVVPAAATDHRIRAVATVSAADEGAWFRDGLGGTQTPGELAAMLDLSAAARTDEARGGEVRRQQIHPGSAPERGEVKKSLTRHIHQGWEYYRTERAHHPRTENWFALRSVDLLTQFDAFGLIALIAPRPLLMIAGTEAVSDYFTVGAVEKAREPKELFWVDGADHVDLYDRDEYVTPAVEKLTGFFTEGLKAPGAVAA
ncbi:MULTISPECIES: alpha/beta hydrolase [unclassified Streptomyces]|uniref:alpha/beta hydrolase n=1 Tax=unclassified Streptomyces TaxID=2593676 RepID=UPI00382C5B14